MLKVVLFELNQMKPTFVQDVGFFSSVSFDARGAAAATEIAQAEPEYRLYAQLVLMLIRMHNYIILDSRRGHENNCDD